jgi:hypothetical protein
MKFTGTDFPDNLKTHHFFQLIGITFYPVFYLLLVNETLKIIRSFTPKKIL